MIRVVRWGEQEAQTRCLYSRVGDTGRATQREFLMSWDEKVEKFHWPKEQLVQGSGGERAVQRG